MSIHHVLKKNEICRNLNRSNLISLLSVEDKDERFLYDFSRNFKWKTLGNKVYLRGLIELSNICTQNCYYCGIRKDSKIDRFSISEEDLI